LFILSWRAKSEIDDYKAYLRSKYGDKKFKTDAGVSMSLEDYLIYSERVKEEKPMYLFDNSFAETEPELLKDYFVSL